MDEILCCASALLLVGIAVWGLASKHHGELNREGVSPERFDELRRDYAGDDVAQQQIDVYDRSTEYHGHFRALRDALKSGDTATDARESRWLEEHYPDV